MKSRKIVNLALALVALATAFTNSAFWPGWIGSPGFRDHTEITNDALLAVGSFSSSARSAISSKADDADWDFTNNTSYHFDTCNWTGSVGNISVNRSDAVLYAYYYWYYNNTLYRDIAYLELGYVFHTAEDFYAHSNWVETHLSNPVPRATLSGSMPYGWNSGAYPNATSTCTQTHDQMNKDTPYSYYPYSSPRGAQTYNGVTYNTLAANVAQSEAQWYLFENLVRTRYGTTTGNAIIAKIKGG